MSVGRPAVGCWGAVAVAAGDDDDDDEDGEEDAGCAGVGDAEKKSSKVTGAEAAGLGAVHASTGVASKKLVPAPLGVVAALAVSCGFIGGMVDGVCAASANAAAKRSSVLAGVLFPDVAAGATAGDTAAFRGGLGSCLGAAAAAAAVAGTAAGCDGGGVFAGGFFSEGWDAGTSGSLTGAGCCGSLSKNDVPTAGAAGFCRAAGSIAETHMRSVSGAAAGAAAAGAAGGDAGWRSGAAAGVTGADAGARKGLAACGDARADAGVFDCANSW